MTVPSEGNEPLTTICNMGQFLPTGKKEKSQGTAITITITITRNYHAAWTEET
jgi:hypothetical protein